MRRKLGLGLTLVALCVVLAPASTEQQSGNQSAWQQWRSLYLQTAPTQPSPPDFISSLQDVEAALDYFWSIYDHCQHHARMHDIFHRQLNDRFEVIGPHLKDLGRFDDYYDLEEALEAYYAANGTFHYEIGEFGFTANHIRLMMRHSTSLEDFAVILVEAERLVEWAKLIVATRPAPGGGSEFVNEALQATSEKYKQCSELIQHYEDQKTLQDVYVQAGASI